MNKPLHQILYVSTATMELSPEELEVILLSARRNNTANQITGMLLYKNGGFMQVLEGEEETLRVTFERICQDSRHKGVLTLLDQPIEQRDFADWAMSFRHLQDSDLKSMPGHSLFMDGASLEGLADGSDARLLMLNFREM